MKTGQIELQEIIEALRYLGGKARAKNIKDRVTEMRGGMPSHYGRPHSYRETIQAMIEMHCPDSDVRKNKPEHWKIKNPPHFERVSRGIYRLINQANEEQLFREATADLLEKQVALDLKSLMEEESITEGGKEERLISYFERVLKLRIQAIAHHGATCKVCGFNFEDTYGEHGKNYIEVHHLIPLSTLPEPTSINPKEDLTVLCSNCHRMIHRKRDFPLSIEELRKILAEKS